MPISTTPRILLTGVILELTLATAIIHLTLGGTLFLLNAAGYLALGAAYLVAAALPMPAVRRLGWLPRDGLAAYRVGHDRRLPRDRSVLHARLGDEGHRARDRPAGHRRPADRDRCGPRLAPAAAERLRWQRQRSTRTRRLASRRARAATRRPARTGAWRSEFHPDVNPGPAAARADAAHQRGVAHPVEPSPSVAVRRRAPNHVVGRPGLPNRNRGRHMDRLRLRHADGQHDVGCLAGVAPLRAARSPPTPAAGCR